MIGTDCIGSRKSNYHTITTMTALKDMSTYCGSFVLMEYFIMMIVTLFSYNPMGCRDRNRVACGITATCAISAYHHYICEFEYLSWRVGLDTTL